MPVHDWTRVDAGLFHAFHHRWIDSLCDALNAGLLPSDYYALPEQRMAGPIPDVLALRLSPGKDKPMDSQAGIALATAPPRARLVSSIERGVYARRTDRISVKHRHGQIVAVIEIVSPGNKSSGAALRAFVVKVTDLIEQGVHVLIIDLFPPGPRDPQGIHKAIWDEFEDEDFETSPGQPLMVAAYSASEGSTAYVEPFGVGDDLPEMPLFLRPDFYVPVPLEATYRTTWGVFPAALKGLLEPEGEPSP